MILILSIILLIRGDFLMQEIKLWNVLLYIAYGIIGFQIFFQFVYAVLYHVTHGDSDNEAIKVIGNIGRVFGFDWSPVDKVTPSNEVLFLTSILFFISFQIAFRRSLDREYAMTAEYIGTHLAKMAEKARKAITFEYDTYIVALEKTFEEKKQRKQRLQKRKHTHTAYSSAKSTFLLPASLPFFLFFRGTQ